MPPDRSGEGRRDAALLLDILLAAEAILSFVAGLDFAASRRPQRPAPRICRAVAAGVPNGGFVAARPRWTK
ncbi:MAG TPA: hypothetical protein VGG11_17475 [Xanthobacteraceae bacterium]|jgi:hypothetical protein